MATAKAKSSRAAASRPAAQRSPKTKSKARSKAAAKARPSPAASKPKPSAATAAAPLAKQKVSSSASKTKPLNGSPSAQRRAGANKPQAKHSKAVLASSPQASAPPTAPAAPAVVSPPSRKAGSSKVAAVELARRSLRTLTSIVEQADDRDAEQILGEGRLEALLKAVLPLRKRSAKTSYDYLASQKRRASLMARIRHSINTTYSFPTDVNQDRFLSPTRVQWFYDGTTFIEGDQPFSGVIGLYRNGHKSYGLCVTDAAEHASLGPSEADFVSIEQARQSFASASKPPSAASEELSALNQDANTTQDTWTATLQAYPWLLGAQHTKFSRVKRDDPNMPDLFAERVDGHADIVLLSSPSIAIVNKGGRVQRSFQDSLQQAEQTLSFVQRQADYLGREFGLKVLRPRAFVLAGRGLTSQEREALRHYCETRHAELRVLTYDDLSELGSKTRAFFEARF